MLRAKWLRPGLLVGPEGDNEVLLRLRAATHLTGTVRDARTGQAVPGAHVCLVPRWDAELVTDRELPLLRELVPDVWKFKDLFAEGLEELEKAAEARPTTD